MKEINSLKDMMLQQIRSLYHANLTIKDSLPSILEYDLSKDLQEFLDLEMQEKVRQQHRMEIIFTILKEEPEGEVDEAIITMVQAQLSLSSRCSSQELCETLLIIGSRAMAMHQINGYQTAISSANNIGYTEISRLLRRALREEKGIEKGLGLLEANYLKICSSITI